MEALTGRPVLTQPAPPAQFRVRGTFCAAEFTYRSLPSNGRLAEKLKIRDWGLEINPPVSNLLASGSASCARLLTLNFRYKFHKCVSTVFGLTTSFWAIFPLRRTFPRRRGRLPILKSRPFP